MKKAFSLIELSVVILIIGILIAGVTQSSRLVKQFRIKTAQTLTQSSPVTSIKDLALWLETSMESSFITAEAEDNTPISTWYDINPQAIKKNNALQATSTNQPKFYDSVFNGGLPAIRFDGVDNFMTFDGTILANSNYTIFLVEQRRVGGSSNVPIIGGTTASTNANFHLMYVSNTTFRLGHYANDLDYTIAGYSSPTPRIHTNLFSTTDGKKYWLNGGSATDSAASGQTTALSGNLGAALGRFSDTSSSYYLNGDIAEIIIFTRSLKTEERQSIETYLSKKYGITIS